MRICPFCGENCRDDDLFCRYCGHDVSYLLMSLDRKKEMLEKAIAKYQSEGWILISQSGLKALVKRTSQLNDDYSIWEIHNILLLVILRWIDYAYHWDERVTLTIDDGHLVEKSNRDIRVVLLALMILIIICFALIFYFLMRA